MAKLGGKDNGSLDSWNLEHMVWANVNFKVGGYVLDYLPIWWYLNHQKFVSTFFTYLFDHMHEKIAQFILLKIPPYSVRLLGKEKTRIKHRSSLYVKMSPNFSRRSHACTSAGRFVEIWAAVCIFG